MFAVPLARLGHDVTVVDPSADALATLRRRADTAGVGDRVRGVQGDGDLLHEVLPATGAGARPAATTSRSATTCSRSSTTRPSPSGRSPAPSVPAVR